MNTLSHCSSKNEQELSVTPKVSVILPVYNAGEFLRPCMDTLVNQTLREIEIICVLDCPSDGSDKVIEEYAAQDDRIVVIRNEQNLNIGESRNVGMRAARGEYIGFSDHDDTRALDMYERLYEATENGKKNVVITGSLAEAYQEDEMSSHFRLSSNKDNYPIYQYLFYTLFLRGGKWYRTHITSNLYSHKHIIKHNLYFVDNKLYSAEDQLFNLLLLSTITNDDEIAILKEHFYFHNIYGGNTYLSSWYGDPQHIVAWLHYVLDLVNHIGWIDPLIFNTVFSTSLQISWLYTSFRKEIRNNGYSQIVKSSLKTIQSDVLVKKTVNSTPILIKGLTLPKRAFLLWLKWICR